MPMVNGKKYPYTAEGKKDAAMAKRSALKAKLDRRTSLDNAADSLMGKARSIVDSYQKDAKHTKKSSFDTMQLKAKRDQRISEAKNAYDKKASYVKKMKG